MRYLAIGFLFISALMGMINQSFAKIYFNKKYKKVKEKGENKKFNLISTTSVLSLIEHMFVIIISIIILFKEDVLMYPSIFIIALFTSYYFINTNNDNRVKDMKESKDITSMFKNYKKIIDKKIYFRVFFDKLILLGYSLYITFAYIM